MLRLITKQEEPPGGYSYTDPDTGHVSRGGSLAECIYIARRHRQANGLAIPDNFDALVEHYICAKLSPQWCKFEDGSPLSPNPDMGVDAIIAGTRAIVGFLAGLNRPDTWVDPAEANRRADICARCPLNSKADGCFACRSVEAVAGALEGVRGNRSTDKDQWLNYCMGCGCSLKLIIWVALDVLNTGLTQEKRAYIAQRASHCWRLYGTQRL